MINLLEYVAKLETDRAELKNEISKLQGDQNELKFDNTILVEMLKRRNKMLNESSKLINELRDDKERLHRSRDAWIKLAFAILCCSDVDDDHRDIEHGDEVAA